MGCCAYCSRRFVKNKAFQKFCSSHCRWRAWDQANSPKVVKLCLICGKAVVPPHRRYCSWECFKRGVSATRKRWEAKNRDKKKKYKLTWYYRKKQEDPGYHARKRLAWYRKKMLDPEYRAKRHDEWKRRAAKQKQEEMEMVYGLAHLAAVTRTDES